LAILLFAYATVRSVVNPIRSLNATMQAIAREDVAAKCPKSTARMKSVKWLLGSGPA
jgi:methyl-accepting chemotaxis protein